MKLHAWELTHQDPKWLPREDICAHVPVVTSLCAKPSTHVDGHNNLQTATASSCPLWVGGEGGGPSQAPEAGCGWCQQLGQALGEERLQSLS